MSGLARWRTAHWLRNLNRVGAGPRLRSRPHLVNQGRIIVGSDFFLSSQPVQSHMESAAGAVIDIGDRVAISYGAAIAAQREIRIGSDTRIGPFVVIMDGDFHKPGNRDASGDVGPVHIGSGVCIGTRVTILRGADIGDGAQVLSGSTVSGMVPAGAIVQGVPALALSEAGRSDLPDIPKLMRTVLGLAKRPDAAMELKEISEWDASGIRRLALAIEEAYSITVRAEELQAVKTVAALCDFLDLAMERSRTAATAQSLEGLQNEGLQN